MLKTLVGVSAICTVSLAGSGDATAGEKLGRITSVHLAQQHVDKVFVKIAGTYTLAEPACSLSVDTWDFVLDISQSTGKAIYAQLVSAQYAQVPVQMVGTTNCALHANYETLSYLVVNH